jgi:hypothetical protein
VKPTGRILSVFLIAFLLMQLTVPFFVIQYKRNAFYIEAKKTMKREMGIKMNVYDVFAHSSFHWEKQGKEFFYKGGLYDVCKLVKQNGKYIMFAIPDFKEKAYLNNIAKNNPVNDNGVFSFAPLHLYPPGNQHSFQFNTTLHTLCFVYVLQCLSPHQLTEDSPPENLV